MTTTRLSTLSLGLGDHHPSTHVDVDHSDPAPAPSIVIPESGDMPLATDDNAGENIRIASSDGSSILISTDLLPTEETIFFMNSSFFKHHTLSDLPTLDAIQTAALPGFYHRVSIFRSLSLVVKRYRITAAHRVSAAEGQTLWAIRQFLPEVRVPEVYGWRRDGADFFLFMEFIDGEGLDDRWPHLTEEEKTDIFAELRTMVRALRHFKRSPQEKFIGGIGGQPSIDSICFAKRSCAFANPEAFYEFFMRIPTSERKRAYEDGLPTLPFDSPIVFTHGDLNFCNILITSRNVKEPPRVLAIIDWEQAGWMPSFWEYSKPRFWMMWQVDMEDRIKRLPEMTGDVAEEVFMAFAIYVQAHGGLL